MATSPGGVEVARISVRAVPDTSKLFEEFKADLKKIEENLSVDIKASVDSAELVASAREAVAEAQAAAGDIDVKARVDTSQLDELDRVVRSSSSATSGLFGGFSLLASGAGLLSTALIPLVGVLAGLALALAAPLAITAGGVTIFGFLAGFALKDTLKQLKTINDLDTKLSGLSKGTQEYKDTLSQLRVAQSGLSPAQAAFAKSLDKVKEAFSNIPSGVLLKPLTDAMGLLADVLPKLTPILKAVSGVFVDLVGNLDKVVKSPGFKGFVKAFSQDLGRDLKAFASIAGNIFIGLGGLFGALDQQLSGGVLKGLENISKHFADFGRDAQNNTGLKAFVKYVKDNLPTVGRLVSGTFSLLAGALQALAPVGTLALDAITGIVGAFQKLGDLSGPLAGTLAVFGAGTFFGGPEVGAAAAAIVALVGGFEQLYQRSKPLQKILRDIGDYFIKTWLPKIQDAARDVMPALASAFQTVSDTIRDNKGFFTVLGESIVAITSAAVIGGIEQLAQGIKILAKTFQVGTAAVKFFANVSLTSFEVILAGIKALVGAILGQFGDIVDGAAAAFGWMPKIGDKVRAAQGAFHAFADSVNGNIDSVGQTLKDLQDKINEVGKAHPRFHVDSNTLDLISQMHQLQALQIQDKHFKITETIEQQLERVTGPGGGMGHPGDTGSGSGSGAGAGSGRGVQININRVEARDTDDLLRKAGSLSRQRAGGGVPLIGGAFS